MRAQPPTTGHSKVVEKAISYPGDHHFYVSHRQNSKKDPLTADEKLDILRKSYPQHKRAFMSSSSKEPTIFHAMSNLHKKGYTHVTVVTGSDRQKEFQKKLDKYNGKFKVSSDGKNKVGYAFNKINVVSAGERNADNPVSGTKVRDAALRGDFASVRSMVHPNLSDDDVHTLISKIRTRTKHPKDENIGKSGKSKGLSKKDVSEDFLNESLYDNIREQYKEGKIFQVGDIVETKNGEIAEIINRGTNYLTLLKEGNVFKTWLSEVKTTDVRKRETRKDGFSYKGYTPQNFTEETECIFKQLTENSVDDYALLNCIRSLDFLLDENLNTKDFTQCTSEFDRSIKYFAKFDLPLSILSTVEDKLIEYALTEGTIFKAADRQKVASILAMSAGVTATDDPVDTINKAAIAMKNKRHTPEGWKIWGKMLNMATKSGIKWNKDIYTKPTQRFMELIETSNEYGPYARWKADKSKSKEQLEKEKQDREAAKEKEGHGVFSASYRELNPELFKK